MFSTGTPIRIEMYMCYQIQFVQNSIIRNLSISLVVIILEFSSQFRV